MTKKRGPKDIINSSNINELKELIIEFDENHNLKSKVYAKDIFDFIKMIANKRTISFNPPSHSWWKSTGKKYLDEYNKVKTKTIRISASEEVDMLDLLDILEKYGGSNKETLKKMILPAHQIVNRLEEKIFSLEEKVQNLNKELNEVKTKNILLQETNEKLQNLVLSLFSISQQNDSGLSNLLNTGKTKSDAVNLSIQKTFGDPLAFVRAMEIKRTRGKMISENNVIEINTIHNLKTLEDDYDY